MGTNADVSQLASLGRGRNITGAVDAHPWHLLENKTKNKETKPVPRAHGQRGLKAAAQESNAQETLSLSVKLGSDFGKFPILHFWARDDEPHLATVSKKEKLIFIILA